MKKKYLWGIVFLGFAVRLFFLLNSENAVSDELEAYSRLNITLDWIYNRSVFPDLNYSTLYFYYLRILFLFSDNIMFLRLTTMCFGVGLLLVFYKFAEIVFSKNNALFSSLIVAFLPLCVNLSVVTLPMVIYVFLMLCALYLFHVAFNLSTRRKQQYFIYSGLFFTIASGFRFEGFVVIFFVVLFLLFRRPRHFHYFIPVSLIFPLAYVFVSYTQTKHLLAASATSISQVSVIMLQFSPLQRVLTYICTISNILTPYMAFLAVLGMVLAFFFCLRARLILFILFGYNSIFLFKSYNASFLPYLERYFLLNVLLLIPFAVYFCEYVYAKIKLVFWRKIIFTVYLLVCFSLCFLFCEKIYGKTKVQYLSESDNDLVAWINKNIPVNKYVFLDRYEHPYFLVNLKADRRFYPYLPFKVDEIKIDDLKSAVLGRRPCYITCKYKDADPLIKGVYSALTTEKKVDKLLIDQLKTVYQNEKWVVYKYE